MKRTIMILSFWGIVLQAAANDIAKNFKAEWEGIKKLQIEKIDDKPTIILEREERIFSKKFYAVAPGKKYILSGNFRSLGEKHSRVYFGFNCYDKNKKCIHPKNSNVILGSETVLVKDCNSGDNVIYIKTNSKWHKNCHVAFNVKDDFSDLPNFTVQRHVKKADIDGDIMKLTLNDSLRKSYPAGTKIRAHENTFGSNIYTVVQGAKMPAKWKLYKGAAQLASPGQAGWKYLRPGTAYVKIILFANYAKKNDEKLALSDLKLEGK